MPPSSPCATKALLLLALASGGPGWPLRAGEAALRFGGGQVLSTPPLLLGPHTLEAWVRPEGPLPPASSRGTIFDWDGRVRLLSSSAGLDYLVDLGGAEPLRLSAPPLLPGIWQHLAASFDGARLRLLVGGKTAAARAAAGQIAGSGPAPAFFGAPGGRPGAAAFAGSLDELRVWDRPRSEEEVEADMNDHLVVPPGPGQGTGESRQGLVAYWDLDEGAGPVARDLAGGQEAVLGDSSEADPRDPSWSVETAPVRKADPGFLLEFEPSGAYAAGSGEVIEVSCLLTTLEGAASGGVSAWSIAVRHDRTHLVLDDATLAGTAAETRGPDGFAFLDLRDDGSLAGFTSRVALTAGDRRTLPPAGQALLARARYRGVLSFISAAAAIIRYDDRLPSGPGEPPANAVRAGGAARKPAEGSLLVDLHAPRFSLSWAPTSATVPPGGRFSVDCLLRTSQNRAASGPGSWSIGVAHDPAVLELTDVTTSGTALDDYRRSDMFLLTERVENGSGTGFVSVVILSLSTPLALPPLGQAVIARPSYRVKEGVPRDARTRLSFAEGLQGGGLPVENQVTFSGGTARPSKAELVVTVGAPLFVRGDADGNQRTDITDAIAILDALFRGSRGSSCLDASDVNDDGDVNITDPVFLLLYLFQSGEKPPPPHLSPGEDQSLDDLDCLEYPSAE